MASEEPQPTEVTTRPQGAVSARRHRARMLVATVLTALVTAFAFLNLNDVRVHWLFSTGQTPLIVVIVLAFGFGVIVDRLVLLRRRRRH